MEYNEHYNGVCAIGYVPNVTLNWHKMNYMCYNIYMQHNLRLSN